MLNVFCYKQTTKSCAIFRMLIPFKTGMKSRILTLPFKNHSALRPRLNYVVVKRQKTTENDCSVKRLLAFIFNLTRIHWIKPLHFTLPVTITTVFLPLSISCTCQVATTRFHEDAMFDQVILEGADYGFFRTLRFLCRDHCVVCLLLSAQNRII